MIVVMSMSSPLGWCPLLGMTLVNHMRNYLSSQNQGEVDNRCVTVKNGSPHKAWRSLSIQDFPPRDYRARNPLFIPQPYDGRVVIPRVDRIETCADLAQDVALD